MKDIQASIPTIQSPIDNVGIKKLHYPIRILQKDNTLQHTIAEIKTSVKLNANQRGTHMSRFVELIEDYKQEVSSLELNKLIKKMITIFSTEHAFFQIEFPYFLQKRAPVTRKTSMLRYECGFTWESNKGVFWHTLFVRVPVTTLCPCSKEISKYGAHNQRAYIRLEIGPKENNFIWLEDLIDQVEQIGSAPIYALLKRPDEKFVTEQAYDNPKFVEDVIRGLKQAILSDYKDKIQYINIEVESDESIHSHMAFAQLEEEL